MMPSLTCPVCSQPFDEKLVKGKSGTLADGRDFIAIVVNCPNCEARFTFSQRVNAERQIDDSGYKELE